MLDYEISKLLSPESIKQSVREIIFNAFVIVLNLIFVKIYEELERDV